MTRSFESRFDEKSLSGVEGSRQAWTTLVHKNMGLTESEQQLFDKVVDAFNSALYGEHSYHFSRQLFFSN